MTGCDCSSCSDFTFSELKAAFNVVRNGEDSKLPISAEITPAQESVTRAAIQLFTGSAPELMKLDNGNLLVSTKGRYDETEHPEERQ